MGKGKGDGAAQVPSPSQTNSPALSQRREATPSPPLPSTRLIVDRAPDVPALISVDSTSMSVQWSPVSITVKSSQLRVVECLEAYALEMQQVEVNSATVLPEVKDERWSVQYSGPATYVQVKGLRPGRNYVVRVACRPIVTDPEVIVETAPPSEVLLVKTPATPPSAPAAPTLAQRQRYSLKFKWAEPLENGGHPILAYIVQCHPPPEGFNGQPTPEGMFEIYKGLEKSVMLKKLVPGARYSARVKAINCIGESPFSPVATFSTQASVPSTPVCPLVCASGQDAVVLQWPPVAGNGSDVSGYQVEMDDGLGGEFNFIGRTQECQFSVSGLRSGLAYRFRIQAENSEGKSQWSQVCTAKTAATAPLAPPPPARESATHSSINITWRPPEYDGGSPLIRYEVDLQPKCDTAKKEMGPEWMRVYEGRGTTCNIEALLAGCMYRVRVRAVNAVGDGGYSFPADVSTAASIPEAPGAPTAATRGQESLVVQWPAPEHDGGAPVVSYRLAYRCVGTVEAQLSSSPEIFEGSAFHTVYDGAERRTEIQGLQPGMKYEFRVAAFNKQGASPWSGVGALTTKAGLPVSPFGAEISHGAVPKSLELRWKKPYGHGAPVDSYIVQMKIRGRDGVGEAAAAPAAVKVPVEADETLEDGAVAAAKNAALSEESLDNPNIDDLFTTVYHSSEPSCIVTGLEPNADYSFRIRSFNSVGASPWSEIITARTAPASPSAPLHLHTPQATRSSITFAWGSPEFDHGSLVTSYQLEFAPATRGQRSEKSEKGQWRSVFKGDAMQYTVNELRPGEQYRARVRAFNACGWGPWTDITSASTHPDVPSAPETTTTSSRTGTSVRLTWGPPAETHGAAVTDYELQMARGSPENAASLQFSTLVVGLDTTFKAAQLSAGTMYCFRVRALNAVGAGPWSRLTSVKTSLMPPLEPTEVQAEIWDGGSSAAAVMLSWTPPRSDDMRAACTSYEIECSLNSTSSSGEKKNQQGGGKGTVKHTCSGKTSQHKITGLKAGSSYNIRVRAIGTDGSGHGAWSAPSIAVQIPPIIAALSQNGGEAAVAVSSALQQRLKAADSIKECSAGSVTSTDYGDESVFGKGQGGGRRGNTKVAVAKAKPRQKTAWTTVAKAVGWSEDSLRFLIKTVGILAVAVVFLLVLLSGGSSGPISSENAGDARI